MRKATVVTESLNLHKEPGSKELVGFLHKNERVTIVGGPVPREKTWYRVENARGLVGWAAERNERVVWLQLDAPDDFCADEADDDPRPFPPSFPSDPIRLPAWVPPVAVLAGLALLALMAWGLG
jgi:hypothetical protein